MKSSLKIVSFLIITARLFFACGESNDNTTETNSPPYAFAVSASNINANSATISWVATTDPDGDTVSYTVILGDSEEASNISTLTFSFSGLSPATSYSGSVVASDGNGGKTSANFSFTTKPQ